ncbi:MAG: ATP synthase A1 subunit C [Euryarchaeota archaeon]|nr:ATP synthase A1 subunit C [Euryarchaeota archaeon]
MFKLGRNKGNYPYAVARVKGKKSRLLTQDNYPKLLMMDLNEISRFMGETQYKVEMAELAPRYDGVNLIEMGTSRNLAQTYRDIIGFTTGELRDIVVAYLRRWDYQNIKTILRGRFSGASLEEIQEDLVPAGDLSERYLISLVGMETTEDVINSLQNKEGFVLPEDLPTLMEQEDYLPAVEDSLDRTYYTHLLKTIQPKRKPEKIFLSYIEREIDIVNLRTLLKLKQAGLPLELMKEYFIEGGYELDDKELERLASTDSFETLLDELVNLSFYDEIRAGVEATRQTGSLSEIMLNLKKWQARQAEKFSNIYPLSVLPVIDFIIRKNDEVNNIRTIARGKAAGMDSEIINKLLVL